jgi:hypothetical protein
MGLSLLLTALDIEGYFLDYIFIYLFKINGQIGLVYYLYVKRLLREKVNFLGL